MASRWPCLPLAGGCPLGPGRRCGSGPVLLDAPPGGTRPGGAGARARYARVTSPPSPPCAWVTDGRRGHGLTQGQCALWLGQWAWRDVLSPRNHRGSASHLGVSLLLLVPGVQKALEQGAGKNTGGAPGGPVIKLRYS